MQEWKGCLKQAVKCTLLFPDGTEVTGTNKCLTTGPSCRRELAGCKTGEGYELCGPPIHAEEDAIAQAKAQGLDLTEGVVAYLEGHTYFCPDCQHSLTTEGVRTLVITGE